MTNRPPHLTDDATHVLARPDHERIYFIRSKRWVPYARTNRVLDELKRLLLHPRTTRMPSIAIYGDSGMGKSMIVEAFRDGHTPTFDPHAGTERAQLLVIEMAGRPGERRLYAQILAALGAPHSPRATIVDLEQATLRLLRAIGVQVLVIDEVHNILAGTWREQRVVLNTLRYLSNELKLSLVCFGIAEAREAIMVTSSWRCASTCSRCHAGRRTRSSSSSSSPSSATCRSGSQVFCRRVPCAASCRSVAG